MPQLVCLPGLLCTPGIFDPVLAALGRGRAVEVPPLDSFEAMVDHLAAGLTEPAVLMGMSMGSYLALALAQRVPEQVAGLILIGTNAAADTPKGAALRGKVAAWAAREGMAALAETIADTMLAQARRDDPALRGAIRDMAETTGLATFAAHQGALAGRPDQTAGLAGIGCPVLVLTGAEDSVTPPDAGRAVAEGVADGRLVLLDGVGHMPVLECPDLVAGHIRDFLDMRVEAA
ncbi:MAG: alpha/beta fold hydrolase [Rhodobacter sp.]|nr:alpha/beta fold hydrolase [Paracoccaceae bacterium]MCC0077312.1 alpha/beta fold hydrolase [Rhodobacter sp.]